MPEVKNTFIGAKMNKDLNPRLVPSKEYIDAKNAAVLNSENGDSGLLQNVDGNTLLTSLGLTDENLEIIGFYIDRALDRMFVFVTNWNDTSLGDSTRFASEQSSHYICMYNISSGQSTVLVSGSFLNFNKSSRMLGINLLEDLLFFTDNRNQPRKINVKLAAANTSYYTEESNISVLKYFPWKAPQLSKNKLSSNQTNKYPLLLNSEFIIKTNFTGATDGTYTVSPATDGNGSGTELKIKVVGGKADTATVSNQLSGDNYAIGDTLTVTGITGQVGDLVVTIGSQNIAQLPTLQDVISPDLPGAVKLTNVKDLIGAAPVAIPPDPQLVGAFVYGNPIKINYNLNAFRNQLVSYAADNIVKPKILTQWDGTGTQGSNEFAYSTAATGVAQSGTGLVLSITNWANDFQIIVVERGNNYCENQTITITSNQMPGLSPIVMDLTLTPRAGENPFESLEYDSFKNGIITSKSSSGVDKLTLSDNITVTRNVATNPAGVYSVANTMEFSPFLQPGQIGVGDVITIGANPDYDGTYDGNNDFISDKFIRFSYRFKFEDNEHSLIAPFSQAAFIPKQDGYFLEDFVPRDINDDTVDSDENRAIKSTIIAFFENKVNKAGIVIDMPEGVDTPADLYDKLKVVEIDILYKDSDETGIRLIDTITKDELIDLKTNQYIYDYKSSMPIQTLRSVDFSRVSDKAPIRAKAQEVAGNRVMYGNYLARTTRPNSLSYNISASPKQAYGTYNSFDTVQYPNHNLKQNRSYEVGIVLADKFGRQSDVITSDNSTVFSNYRQSRTGLNSWMGDSLKISWTNSIPTTIGTPGYAGLYSETNPLGWYSYKVVVKQTAQDYYNIYLPTILNNTPASNTLIINPIAFINSTLPGGPDILSVSLKDAISSEWLGSILTGTEAKFTAGDSVELIEISGDGTILYFNNTNATAFTLGEGILTIPNFDPPVSPNLAYVTLFSDNINKAPRDLKQVASDDITFSSSVEVYGRVWNNRYYQYKSSNIQFFPNDNKISDKITRVGTRDALGLNENSKGYITSTSPFNTIPSPYEKGGNPFIGEVATQRTIGATGGKAINPYVTFENVRLNVYETAPFESNLDIYYESSSSGLISELNSYIAQDSSVNQPAGLIDWSWQLRESDTPGTYVNLAWFDVSNSLGDSITSNNLTGQIVSVTNPSGAGFGVNLFTLERNEVAGSPDQYKFKLKISANNYFVFNNLSATNDRYIFTFRFTNLVSGISYIENVTTTVTNELDNVAPGFIGEQSPFTPYPNSPVELLTTDTFLKGALDERTFNGTNGTASTLPNDFKEGLEWEVTNVEFYWDAYSEWRPYKPYFNFSPINNFGVYMTINKDTFLQPYNNISETLSYNSIFTCLNTASQSEGNGTGLFSISARNNTQFRVSLRLFDASGISGSLSTSSTAQFTLMKNTNR
jgi:hypothetical protein